VTIHCAEKRLLLINIKGVNVAAQPRDPHNKATKIAWKILGKPQNMVYQGNRKQEELERRLNYEDTRLVR